MGTISSSPVDAIETTSGLFGALFFGIGAVSVASAQLTTADVLGTITDSTGAVVPAAKATIKNLGTGVTATAQSNATGDRVRENGMLQAGTAEEPVLRAIQIHFA